MASYQQKRKRGEGAGSNGKGKRSKSNHREDDLPVPASALTDDNDVGIEDREATVAVPMISPMPSADDVHSGETRAEPASSSSDDSSVSSASSLYTKSSGGGDKLDETWSLRLEELRLYRAENGHCLVPKKSPSNPQLGIWVMNQRAQMKLVREGNASTMTPERIEALESLGFTWSLCDHVDWDSRLGELQRYKAKHGNCLVPNKYAPNPQLGTWVNKQRTQYKLMRDGRPSSMTPKRVAALEGLGFVWSKRDLVDWEARLSELKSYRDQHGDCLVPNKYAPNPQLGTWVMHQRAQYRKFREGKSSPMTLERARKLEHLGFVWSTSSVDSDWDARLRELSDFKALHGHCRVPNKYAPNPKLGTWVSKQRKQHKQRREGKPSTLTDERVDALSRIGFAWSLRTFVEWEARLDELRAYRDRHGHCLVPQQYPMNPQLGTWVSNQRKQFRLLNEGRASPMTRERIVMLEELGFVWSIFNHEAEQQQEASRRAVQRQQEQELRQETLHEGPGEHQEMRQPPQQEEEMQQQQEEEMQQQRHQELKQQPREEMQQQQQEPREDELPQGQQSQLQQPASQSYARQEPSSSPLQQQQPKEQPNRPSWGDRPADLKLASILLQISAS